MKYNAFISYSHEADSGLTTSIERTLETFAKPVFKKKALNIFRDASNLSATPNLWGKIQEALEQSEYFIFFASSIAAESTWCQKETRYWIDNKDKNKFLIVLTEGDIFWDDVKKDFNWKETTCIPRNLSGVFENEPLYVDLRELPTDLTIENKDYAKKVVLLAATLHNLSVEDLISEDVLQHKRIIRNRNIVIMVLGLLLLIMILLASFAYKKKNEAILKANEALGNSYISASKSNLESNPTMAIRLAEYAYHFAKRKNLKTEKFEDQLIRAFYQRSNFYLKGSEKGVDGKQVTYINNIYYPPFFPITSVEHLKLKFNKKDKLLIASKKDNKLITIIDIGYKNYSLIRYHLWHSFSPKGHFVLELSRVISNAGQYIEILQVFDLLGNKIDSIESSTIYNDSDFYPADIQFNEDESRFILFGHGLEVKIKQYEDKKIDKYPLNIVPEEILSIGLSSFGDKLAMGLRRRGTLVQTRYNGSWYLVGQSISGVHSVSFSENGKYIITTSNQVTRRWNAENDSYKKFILLKNGTPLKEENVFYTDGDQGSLNYIDKDNIIEYRSPAGKKIAVFKKNTNELGFPTTEKWVSPDRRYYVTYNGLFNNKDEQLITLKKPNYGYKYYRNDIGFSNNGKFFLYLNKLILLDHKMILDRLTSNKFFGNIGQLSTKEKKIYLIQMNLP